MTRKEFLALPAGLVAARLQQSPPSHSTGATPESPKPSAPAGITNAVVDFVARTTIDSIPGRAIEEAKRCLIDGFGVVLAGSTTRGSAIVRELVGTFGDAPHATLLAGRASKASAPHAALANASSGHAMDYDDTQLSDAPDRVFGLLTHPTVPVLAAALAVAEQRGAAGRAFLEAFLVGFEVECKIAEAIRPDHYLRGYHSTGTIGTFGAAAAAAKLMALPPPAIAHAIGIAASMASGIRVNFGSMTKPLHAGRAAGNGVVAAALASRGFTAGDEALDGEWGFFQVAGGGADVQRIVGALGNPYSIVSPGISVKPYPCGSLGHPTMDAMLELVTDHDVKPDQIARVRVRAGSNILNPLRYKTAKTELEAKFCLPFMMASIALRRRAGIREFTDAFVSSAPVQALMARVETIFDRDIEARGFDQMRSIVEVDLTDGRTLSQAADERYRGGPDRPFTREELRAKFADCASLVLSEANIRRALEAIDSVDRMPRIGELVTALTA